MESLWTKTSVLPKFPRLTRDCKTDVLIIGGGMAGILCAHRLRQAGIDAVIAEAGRICGGVTKNTTAKITSQHGLIYDTLIRRFGIEKARMYLASQQAAAAEYRVLCSAIDCGFSEQDSYVYSRRDRSAIEREIQALHRLGFQAEWAEQLPLPFPVAGAVRFRNQAQFHPLQFVSEIVRGLRIYEHTEVRALVGTTALTGHGTIDAEKIIVATHFPFLNRHGAYFLKLYQQRSYVIAFDHAADVHGMYVDEDSGGFSFRNAEGRLLIGGGGHRTGKPGDGWSRIESLAQREYPDAHEAARWATQDCMTLDGVPYIGPYSRRTDGLFVATGFNKWGMTSSMVSAMLLCDLIQGKPNSFASLYSPARTMLRPQLAANAFEATVSLLTPTAPRCPHLGCALKWNKAEHSWDCPCHGSRFTSGGRLINNPATGSLPHRNTPHR